MKPLYETYLQDRSEFASARDQAWASHMHETKEGKNIDGSKRTSAEQSKLKFF